MGHPDFVVVEGQQPPWYGLGGKGEGTPKTPGVIGERKDTFKKIKIKRHDKILSRAMLE